MSTRDEVLRLLERSRSRGMTAGMIAEQISANKSTVAGAIGELRSLGHNVINSGGYRLADGPVVNHASSPDDIEKRRVYRDPCFMCGVRADVGCRHRLAA